MINHVRTHIMNQPSGRYYLRDIGEEYIDPAFRPRRLPLPLQPFYSAVFGSSPDRIGLNYRMYQIMRLLHATSLADDMFVRDKRITYLPFTNTYFTKVFTQTVAKESGSLSRFELIGSHVPSSNVGKLQASWQITINDDDAIVTLNDQYNSTVTVTTPSKGIQLPGSKLLLFLYGASDGTRVRVTSTAKHDDDIITAILRGVTYMGGQGLSLLMPPLPDEPVATWARIWQHAQDTPTKCTALLLTLAHFVETLE